ncbi:MAG: c-type cytochrome, partial [Rubripirellula sp.]|nr:c-type cytochrome [Rubripirellula sp.]
MKWTSFAACLSGFMASWFVCLLPLFAQTATATETTFNTAPNPTELKEQATRVLSTYCVSCHGTNKQEGEVQLHSLESLDAVDQQSLFRQVQDVVHLTEMPPEKASQPTDAERKILLQWIDSQVNGKAAQALAEKLLRFEYGNVVDHE